MIRTALYVIAAAVLWYVALGGSARARTPIQDILRANIESDLTIVRELRNAKSLDELRERLWTIENDLTRQQSLLGQ